MKIYNATQTLKGFNRDLEYTSIKQEAKFIIVGGKQINLEEFPNLKGIFKTGVGIDNLPFEEAKKRGIEIKLPSSNTKEIIYNETASFTVFLILRFIYRNIGSFKSWDKIKRNTTMNFNVLILGCGEIGNKVKHRLSVMCNVFTYDPLQNEESELNFLIEKADIVTIHVPLNEKNINFFDKQKLSLLKDNSLIVNTSRGQIINEESLYNELKSGRINAAIDVFNEEPYNGILTNLKSDNLFLTPHVASTSIQFYEGLAKDFRKFYFKYQK